MTHRPQRDPATPDEWRRRIMQYIAAHPDRPLRPRALGRELGVPPDDAAAFRAVVRQMLDEGQLRLGRGRGLLPAAPGGTVVGVFRAHRRGFGFLEIAGSPDVFVPPHATLDALDGDTVAARIEPPRRQGDEPRAEIVQIVTRAAVRYVGILERRGGAWVVQPQGRAPAPLVSVDDPTAKAARPGDLVVVEPLPHTLRAHGARGVIVERLGRPDETQAKVLAVIQRFGLPHEFPEPVRAEAQRIAGEFDEDRCADGREDLRDLLTITIDPPDARDFDDAISIEPLPHGRTRLGVHIADVAHFVPLGGELDEEAFLRGTSVYFPRYVVPMLPEVLSNGVCSLQPDCPRLTNSVFLTYDETGRPVESRFARSVIRSSARLSYEDVSAFLDQASTPRGRSPARRRGGSSRPSPISKDVASLLLSAEALARSIRARRIADGMIVLNVPDVQVVLDDDGRVCDARPADTSFSHTIIEMFMVEANEAVSRLLDSRRIRHIRRVHPPPAPDAADRFRRIVESLGRPVRDRLDRSSIRRLLDDVQGKPEAPVINTLLLRCMAQACYSTSATEHFALASEHYCHFTSPIRRYPDLVNHRLLAAALEGGAARGGRRARSASDVLGGVDLDHVAQRCSLAERRAEDAERELTSALLIELMKGKQGECFDAVVNGVSSIGAFVQVWPTLAEGLVHKSDFARDLWHFDRDRARFVGRRTGRVIRIGTPLRVTLTHVDDVRLEMSFVPAPDPIRSGSVDEGTRERVRSRGRRAAGELREGTPQHGAGKSRARRRRT